MAFTNIYTLELVRNVDLGTATKEADVTALANGGYAAVGNLTGGIFTPSGTQTATFSLVPGSNDVAQLSNGNLVAITTSTSVFPNIFRAEFKILNSASGAQISSGQVLEVPGGGTVISAASEVAAMSGGRFVVVSSLHAQGPDGMGGTLTTYVTYVSILNSDGSPVESFSFRGITSTVAALDNGNFAVAWEDSASSGTEIWYAVYSPDGVAIQAPTLLDGSGSRNPTITATNAGFAIAWEDNGWNTGMFDITLATFGFAGNLLNTINASNPALVNDASHDQSPVLSRLSNGMLVMGWENNAASDTNMLVGLYDAAGTSRLAFRSVTAGEESTDDVGDASLAGFGTLQLAVYFTNATDNDIDGAILEPRHRWTSDAAGDTIAGDGMRDWMIGNAGNDTLIGNGGFDELFGGADNDTLDGGADGDTLDGGTGDDVLIGGGGADLLMSGSGNDQLNGGDGDDGLYFGAFLAAADAVNGGAGSDQLGLQGNYAGFTFGSTQLTNIEQVVLLPGNDTRFFDTANNFYSYFLATVDANVAAGAVFTVNWNTLRAGENVVFDGAAELDGSFLTYGGSGNDQIAGGQQIDGFYFGAGRWNPSDRLIGEGGNDQLGLQGDYSGVHAIVFGPDQLISVEAIVLLSGSDTRFGGGAANFSYTLSMHNFNVAGGTTMTINANTLRASEVLTFNGANEIDGVFRVFSGAGNDVIAGGAGADHIYGGAGVDTLSGGAGADLFGYISASHSTQGAADTITDFTLGDKIDLSAIDANSSTGGNEAFAFIGSGAFTNVAGQLRAVDQGGGTWLVQGDVDGNGTADLWIVVNVTGGHQLSSTDFAL